MKVWRISNHGDLSGRGGLRAAGRWHCAGRPIVYLAEHPASALLEVLVHFDIGDVSALPVAYQLPTDTYVQPSRAEFFLGGKMEGSAAPQEKKPAGSPTGFELK